MSYPMSSASASSLIGQWPQEVSRPNSSASNVVHVSFDIAAFGPQPGTKPLRDRIARLEAEPASAALLADARKVLAAVIEPDANTLRAVRLSRGFSQAVLAERAQSTQAYVARLECGKVDPGTDMVVRLAQALGVGAEVIFAAVRRQRDSAVA